MSDAGLEAEVLRNVLLYPGAYDTAAGIIPEPEAFSDHRLRQLWNELGTMHERGVPIALADSQLNPALMEHVDLDAWGGWVGLLDFAHGSDGLGPAGCGAFLANAAQNVAALAHRRAVKQAGGLIAQAAEQHRGSAAVLAGRVGEMVEEVQAQEDGERSVGLADLVPALAENLIAISRGEAPQVASVPTGFWGIDAKTHGFRPGELIILAARPSMGKTSLAGGITLQAARAGYPVLFFSLEVGAEQLATNWLSQLAEVDGGDIRGGTVDEHGLEAIRRAAAELAELPIEINYTSAIPIRDLRTAVRQRMARHPVGLVVIDYLQLMRGLESESRQHEVSTIAQGLKAMARDLGVPVLALAQLNRNVDQREDHRPRLSDLRESGSIEQEADVIMFLYRLGYYEPEEPAHRNHAVVIVAKNRHGATGDVRLHFEPPFALFTSPSVTDPY